MEPEPDIGSEVGTKRPLSEVDKSPPLGRGRPRLAPPRQSDSVIGNLRTFHPGLQELRQAVKKYERDAAVSGNRGARNFKRTPNSGSFQGSWTCDETGCPWRIDYKQTRQAAFKSNPFYVKDCCLKHTCFGVTTSRVEYWEIRESPAFKANESKSRKDRCNNVTLAAEIQREGKINPSAFQVSQAKRAVAGDTRRSHKLPPVRPPSFKIRSSMNTSDFLDVVDDNLLCTICQNVMVSPSCCGQGHQFCLECISKWIEQSPTCPSCSGDLTVSSLTKLRLVENMINKLRVRCCHAGVKDGPSPGPKNLRRRSRPDVASSAADSEVAIEGCGWIGALGNRAKHLEDECMHSEVECSCEGCDAKVPRFQ
eukprot:2502978-Rhodomonas_salina.1